MWGRGWGVCAAAPGSENYLCRRTEWTCGLDTWSHPSFRPPEDGAARVWQHKDLNMTISRSRIVLQHHMIMLWYITVKPFLINEQNLLVPDWGIYKILNWSYKHWRNVHSPSHMGSGGGLAPQCELPCSSTASAAAHESSYQESRVYWDSAGSTSETKSQGLSFKVFRVLRSRKCFIIGAEEHSGEKSSHLIDDFVVVGFVAVYLRFIGPILHWAQNTGFL